MLRKGDNAIEFCLPDDGWDRTCLNEFRNKKVILYFFPMHNRRKNVKEACMFRDAYERIKKERGVVVGVSSHYPRDQKKFIEKYKLPFSLLSDTHYEIAQAYGVLQERQSFGRKYPDIIRSTFIIDEHGKIQNVFIDVDMKEHVDEVLYELQN